MNFELFSSHFGLDILDWLHSSAQHWLLASSKILNPLKKFWIILKKYLMIPEVFILYKN